MGLSCHFAAADRCILTKCAANWFGCPVVSIMFPVLSKDWVRILSANDRRASNIYFQRGVYQVSPGDMR